MRFSFIAILAACPLLALAQPTWQRSYGGLGGDQGYGVRETADGGSVIVGSTGSFGSGGGDVYLLKLDIQGEREWSKTFGGLSVDVGTALERTADGGFVIAGYTNSGQGAGYDGLLIRIDAFGNELWQKHIGTSSWDLFYGVDVLNDGFLAAGVTYGQGALDGDLWLVRTDDQGDTLWTRAFASVGEDEARSVRATTDGNVVVAGSLRVGTDTADAVLLKYDDNGQFVWPLLFGGDSLDAGMSVVEAADGSYLLGGYSRSSMDAQVFLLGKAAPDGTAMWTSYINTPVLGSVWSGASIRELPDQRIALAGSTNAFGAGAQDFYLLFTDANGNYLSGPSFGGLEDDICWSLDLTSDGSYIMTGSSESFGPGTSSVYVVRTDGDVLTTPVVVDLDPLGVSEVSVGRSVVLVPDPAASGESVRLIGTDLHGNALMKVFSAQGALSFARTVNVEEPIVLPLLVPGSHVVVFEGKDSAPVRCRLVVH